jgi:hypothetical protein
MLLSGKRLIVSSLRPSSRYLTLRAFKSKLDCCVGTRQKLSGMTVKIFKQKHSIQQKSIFMSQLGFVG